MIYIDDNFKTQLYSKQDRILFWKIVFEDLGGIEFDMTPFVESPNSISRSLSYEFGKFSPAGHSFQISNTKDLGEYLFTLRQNYGAEEWTGKIYNIYWGFNNPISSSAATGQLVTVATLGFGDDPTIDKAFTPATFGWGTPASGFDSSSRLEEDTILIYKGRIHNKSENRLKGEVNIASKSVLKDVHDYTVGAEIGGNVIFENDTSGRSVVQEVRYGVHKLNTVDGRPIKDRNNPFSCVLGLPNVITDRPNGTNGSLDLAAGQWWYFPTENELANVKADFTAGTFKLYYWNYIDNIWEDLLASIFVSNWDFLATVTGLNGVFVKLTVVHPTWTTYIEGTDVWASDNPDPMICMECEDLWTNGGDQNPARFIWDLLYNSRFLGMDGDLLDIGNPVNPFSPADTDYSFDDSWDYFDSNGGTLNIANKQTTTLMDLIQSILSASALFFFTSGEKVKLVKYLPEADATPTPAPELSFSTKQQITDLVVETEVDNFYNRILTKNYRPDENTFDNMELVVAESAGVIAGTDTVRLLESTPNPTPSVYWYNAISMATLIVANYLSYFGEPPEWADIDLNIHAVAVEPTDYISIHDHISGETNTYQVYNKGFALSTGKISLKSKKMP